MFFRCDIAGRFTKRCCEGWNVFRVFYVAKIDTDHVRIGTTGPNQNWVGDKPHSCSDAERDKVKTDEIQSDAGQRQYDHWHSLGPHKHGGPKTGFMERIDVH